MANFSGYSVVNGTLAASTVSLVVLTRPAQGIKVTNIDGTAPIYFRVSHPGGSNAVPSIVDGLSYVVSASAGAYDFVRHDGMYGMTVQLVSPGTPKFAVETTSKNSPN
jgi:hypothetical protein